MDQLQEQLIAYDGWQETNKEDKKDEKDKKDKKDKKDEKDEKDEKGEKDEKNQEVKALHNKKLRNVIHRYKV